MSSISNIAIILGTRPEIIKLSPLVRKLEASSIQFFIIHTNQHYSKNMDEIFFEELKLPQPKYNLNVFSLPHGKQVAKMLEGIEEILFHENPDVVIVQGDTNTTLAGAIATSKIDNVKLAHVEAGLRSFDKRMPEEINRKITDHLSDFLFAPTSKAKENLNNEGIYENIFVVGNTIVDAIFANLKIASASEKVKLFLKELGFSEYFLITLHRAENVDLFTNLQKFIKSLELIGFRFSMPMIFPIHPRTRKRMQEFGLWDKLVQIPNLKLIEPVGYLEFLALLKNAKLVLTDSGGIQEECCVLKVPCVTLRENTERPETVEVGANVLAGLEPEKVILCVEKMLNVKPIWNNPFGDGKASEKILNILLERGT
jgi:UDP-N-acetylglucosamine 2-epimerase (non-hydrolysing)